MSMCAFITRCAAASPPCSKPRVIFYFLFFFYGNTKHTGNCIYIFSANHYCLITRKAKPRFHNCCEHIDWLDLHRLGCSPGNVFWWNKVLIFILLPFSYEISLCPGQSHFIFLFWCWIVPIFSNARRRNNGTVPCVYDGWHSCMTMRRNYSPSRPIKWPI